MLLCTLGCSELDVVVHLMLRVLDVVVHLIVCAIDVVVHLMVICT